MNILLFFIDGFGIGADDPDVNPIISAETPAFDYLFSGQNSIVINTDTTQGISGLPQSATGQTAILTGINAAKVLGHHQSGFPGPTLKKIIAEENILLKLKKAGKKVTFANAYTNNYVKKASCGEIKASVTTVCVSTSGIKFRLLNQLREGKAVYQDFTNKRLLEKGYDLPLLKPAQAAKNLAGIVRKYDFTLYEFFQTDITGHRQNLQDSVSLLERLDLFLVSLLTNLNLEETLLIITSDHGNIEDISLKTHTTNPVPTILIGTGKEKISNSIRELKDITPAIISLLS